MANVVLESACPTRIRRTRQGNANALRLVEIALDGLSHCVRDTVANQLGLIQRPYSKSEVLFTKCSENASSFFALGAHFSDREACPDFCSGLLHRVIGQMRVSCSRQYGLVSEQLSDERQGKIVLHSNGRIGMSQVVNADTC